MTTAEARRAVLRDWFRALSDVPGSVVDLQPVAGDASFRRYYRVAKPGGGTLILCDAPPAQEKSREFAAVARALADAGVRVPEVLEANFEDGFLVLEDLGDQLLLPELSPENVDTYYARALEIQQRIATIATGSLALPAYDAARLIEEMDLFPRWFCEGLLGMPLTADELSTYAQFRMRLVERALAQPQVVVHRDFHSRNLMLLADGDLAVIDFQDAVIGPLSYDPVSLLRDCYLRWPAADVQRWAREHRHRLEDAGIEVPRESEFLVDFDWMGLQRHIKVLGIFARLKLRDGKSAYLEDLPRVAAYVGETLAQYSQEPAIRAFAAWFEARVLPRVEQQPWYSNAEPS
ncbi:MAG: phosphotransferase [Pseudomonadota bacterium]